MKIKQSEKYNAVILEIRGNVLGGPEAQEFGDLLHKLLEENKMNIIVDLSDVKFMNSSGLGMMISGLTTVSKAGGKFKLAGVGEKIQSLLIITKLITIFETYDTVDLALESLGK